MNYSRDSYFQKRADAQKRMRISYGKIEKNKSDERELKKMDIARNFSKDLFDKGIAWFNSGLALSDADESLKTNRSFVNGFNHGYRLSLVRELEQNIKKDR